MDSDIRRELRIMRIMRVCTGTLTIAAAGLGIMAFQRQGPRLRMLVDSLGNPRVEFLNDSGRVVMKLPTGC